MDQDIYLDLEVLIRITSMV